MGATGVRLGDDGRLRVTRTAPPEDPDQLRRVVARLRAAAGPGVVPVLAFDDDGDAIEVVLGYGGRALTGPLPGDRLAPIVASVAAHVADIQLKGLAHGDLRAEHVLVDPTGAVQLCGLADGDSGNDVVALGQLIDDVLDPGDRSVAAIALRAVAARCATEDPAARPTMAALAASLATAAPTARTLSRPRATEPRGASRSRALVAAVVVALVAVVTSTAAARAMRRPSESPSITATTATRPSSSTTSSIVRAARVWPRSAPRTFDHEGATWTFGTDDDQLVLGRWHCGAETPALVEADGDVFVIDEWPTADQLVARYVTTVDDVERASVEHDGACDRLVLTTVEGELIEPALAA